MAAAFRTWIRGTHQIPHDLSHPRQREGGATSRHRPARVRICRHRELLSRSWLQNSVTPETSFGRVSTAGEHLRLTTANPLTSAVQAAGSGRRTRKAGAVVRSRRHRHGRTKRKPQSARQIRLATSPLQPNPEDKRPSHSIKLPCRCTNPSQGRVHCRHRGLRMSFEKNGAFERTGSVHPLAFGSKA